jgi:pyruvate formate lyase activating enzyme
VAKTSAAKPAPLEAKSPFEMRVNLSKELPETDVQSALDSGDMGFLHSFTTGSTVDGPGVRVVAWTTGCMWRCRYCHNPDTWTMRNGYPVSVARAADELRKYTQGLKVMSGGLTVSGGEPLMQHRFVLKLLKAAKGMGVHTTIETNGFLGDQLTDADFESIDLVMLGLKKWDPEGHKELTGPRRSSPTLRARSPLAATKAADVGPFRARAGSHGRSRRHQEDRRVRGRPSATSSASRCCRFTSWGGFKWKELGIKYHLDETKAPTAEAAEKACAVFRAAGLKAN